VCGGGLVAIRPASKKISINKPLSCSNASGAGEYCSGLASGKVWRDHCGVNAIDPPLKMRPLTSESRLLRRGSLGGIGISGRSREGRLLRDTERALIEHCGGSPSFTQKLLIRRISRAVLRLELLDEKVAHGQWTDHDSRTFGGLSNALRLMLRELGLKPSASEKPLPSLDEIVRGST
jgi:hypothetical protein